MVTATTTAIGIAIVGETRVVASIVRVVRVDEATYGCKCKSE